MLDRATARRMEISPLLVEQLRTENKPSVFNRGYLTQSGEAPLTEQELVPEDKFRFMFDRLGPNDPRTLDAAVEMIEAGTRSLGSLTRVCSFCLGSEVRENLVRSGRMLKIFEDIGDRASINGEKFLVSDCQLVIDQLKREREFYGVIDLDPSQWNRAPSRIQEIDQVNSRGTISVRNNDRGADLTLLHSSQAPMISSEENRLASLPRSERIQTMIQKYGVSDSRVIKLAEEHIRLSNGYYTQGTPIRTALQQRGLYIPALEKKIELFEFVLGRRAEDLRHHLHDAVEEKTKMTSRGIEA